ncbi:MAG TPA: CoA-binding protein, partial [Burkholderiales bacterium]
MSASVSTEDDASRAQLAAALFAPATVALIGAADDPASILSRPQRVLRRHGYRGRIVPIHPSRTEIAGERAYPSAAAVPGGIDHALVMVPAPAAANAIRDCGRAGAKVATIFSAGFAEAGERGRRRQEGLLAAARAAGVRILGPNSLGAIDVSARFALSLNSVLEHEPLRPGGLALVSQSGSMLGAVLTRAQERGLGFSRLVSTGNECDLATGEIVHMLVDDPATRAILLFLETLRDADELASAARRAFAAGKPVIAYKIGRSAAGRELAASHTGALATDERAAQAFFRAHGILHVEVL